MSPRQNKADEPSPGPKPRRRGAAGQLWYASTCAARTFREHRPRRYRLVACVPFADPHGDPRDWIEFHLAQGFDHFDFYAQSFPPEAKEILARYIKSGLLTLVEGFDPSKRTAIYRDHLSRTGRRARWSVLLAPHQCLFSREVSPLPSILSGLEDFAGICVLPKEGSDRTAPPNLGNEERAAWLNAPAARALRIINPAAVRKIARHGVVLLSGGRLCVDTQGVIETQSAGGRNLRAGWMAWRRAGRFPGQAAVAGHPVAPGLRVQLSGMPAGSLPERSRSRRLPPFTAWNHTASRSAQSFYLNLRRPKYLAACLCFRDAASYIREWLAFHWLVGFEHFYLYNHESADDFRTALRPWLDSGRVTLFDVTFARQGKDNQKNVYRHCIRTHARAARWIAFLDDDEFLFPARDRSLPDVLQSYESFAGLSIPWLVFGSGGHRERPEGLVIENYVRRKEIPSNHVKCIIDPARAIEVMNPHLYRFRHGAVCVDERKRPVSAHAMPDPRFDRFRLHHYFTKSEEDIRQKIRRGSLGRGREPYTQELENRIATAGGTYLNAVEDRTIHRYLRPLREAMASDVL